MNLSSDNRLPFDEGVVCPNCLRLNAPPAGHCAACGAPIGMVSNLDPMQRIQSEGFGYRSAVDGPPRLIVLVGIWMIFLPGVFAAPALFLFDEGPPIEVALALFFYFAVAVPLLFRVTKNYIVKKREQLPPLAEP